MLVPYRSSRLIIARLDVPRKSFCSLRVCRRPQASTTNVSTDQIWRVLNRGKRTKTAFKVQESPSTSTPLDSSASIEENETTSAPFSEDLLQYGAPLQPLQIGDKNPQYPTVILQARNNMRKFENCVLLTRVGGFYELYFEQAEQYGPQLNLKVGEKKTVAGPVAMVRTFPPAMNTTDVL